MNTRIYYLYRDASNYKKGNEVVIAGELTQSQQEKIISCLDEGTYFIPSMVGLPEERFGVWTDDDHDWFELYFDDFETTKDDPTVDISTDELVKRFCVASETSWSGDK